MSINRDAVTKRFVHLRECNGVRGKHDELKTIQDETGKTMRIVGTCLVAEIPFEDGVVVADIFSFVGKRDQGARKRGRQITEGRLEKLLDVLDSWFGTTKLATEYLAEDLDRLECVRLHTDGFDAIQRAPINELKRSVGVR